MLWCDVCTLREYSHTSSVVNRIEIDVRASNITFFTLWSDFIISILLSHTHKKGNNEIVMTMKGDSSDHAGNISAAAMIAVRFA